MFRRAFTLQIVPSENIAFGVPKDQIDLERVRQAAAQAQIASFIESNPEGYESFVGERGIRLSGGQRQDWYRQSSLQKSDSTGFR